MHSGISVHHNLRLAVTTEKQRSLHCTGVTCTRGLMQWPHLCRQPWEVMGGDVTLIVVGHDPAQPLHVLLHHITHRLCLLVWWSTHLLLLATLSIEMQPWDAVNMPMCHHTSKVQLVDIAHFTVPVTTNNQCHYSGNYVLVLCKVVLDRRATQRCQLLHGGNRPLFDTIQRA